MSDFNTTAEISNPAKRKQNNVENMGGDEVEPPNKKAVVESNQIDNNTVLEYLKKLNKNQENTNSKLDKMQTQLNIINRRVEKLELENNFIKFDPWKDMALTDRSRVKSLRSKIIPAKVPDKCWLTGQSSSEYPNKAAHILPDSTPLFVLKLLKLGPAFRNDINSERWNFMILRNDVEEAFDSKKISFVPVDVLHPDEFILKIWSKDGLKDDILKLDGCKLNVPDGVQLCRRALSYQALMAYLTLKYDNKDALDLDEPADFSSEYEGIDEVRKSLASTFHTCLHQEHSEDDEEHSEDDDK